MEKAQKPLLFKLVTCTSVFVLLMIASLYFHHHQKQKEIEIENERKQQLLKMTPAPHHKGVETGGEPKDAQAKTRRDFVRKVN